MTPLGWRLRGWPRIGLVLVILGFFAFQSWQERQRPAGTARNGAGAGGRINREERPGPQIIQNEYYQPAEASRPNEASRPAAETATPTNNTPVAQPGDERSGLRTVISGQTIRNLDGRVIFRGDVDVGATLARIERGERLRFPNDGTVFQNRERRLPRKAPGYYREFVHPTRGESGPGPQRIVAGKEGEFYYTPDHYRTFQRLDGP